MLIDCRYQRVRDPFKPGQRQSRRPAPLLGGRLRRLALRRAPVLLDVAAPHRRPPFDRAWFDRRDALGFALGEAGDPRARAVLQRIVARDQDPAKRERAARLLATLDGSTASPAPTY